MKGISYKIACKTTTWFLTYTYDYTLLILISFALFRANNFLLYLHIRKKYWDFCWNFLAVAYNSLVWKKILWWSQHTIGIFFLPELYTKWLSMSKGTHKKLNNMFSLPLFIYLFIYFRTVHKMIKYVKKNS